MKLPLFRILFQLPLLLCWYQNWNSIITFPFEYIFPSPTMTTLFIHKIFSPIFTFRYAIYTYLHKQSTECVYEMNTEH